MVIITPQQQQPPCETADSNHSTITCCGAIYIIIFIIIHHPHSPQQFNVPHDVVIFLIKSVNTPLPPPVKGKKNLGAQKAHRRPSERTLATTPYRPRPGRRGACPGRGYRCCSC
mmetsp:Transcript_10865/g.18557  ORF Transcript_10865/g.18557 Transcript_10865/m.18557 type:complete len:114 (-) Transcript_10865:17-358(-)